MKKLFGNGRMVLLLTVVFLGLSMSIPAMAKDLNASLAFLPNILESPEEGVFIDLVKAIDDAYAGGEIKIRVYPFTRSMENVIQGKADFHLPMMRNTLIPEDSLPFRYATTKMGEVVMVLYSNRNKPVTPEMIEKMKGGSKFPL